MPDEKWFGKDQARVRFRSNANAILDLIDANTKRALIAMGEAAVGATIKQMQSGYGKPIWQTGDLQRSVSHGIRSDHEVDVGSNIDYAIFVHDGTRFMKARPFLKDAIEKNKEELSQVGRDYLKPT